MTENPMPYVSDFSALIQDLRGSAYARTEDIRYAALKLHFEYADYLFHCRDNGIPPSGVANAIARSRLVALYVDTMQCMYECRMHGEYVGSEWRAYSPCWQVMATLYIKWTDAPALAQTPHTVERSSLAHALTIREMPM